MHLASTKHLVLTDDGYVIFTLTSHYAGTASRALVQVYGHSPLMKPGRIRMLVVMVGMFIRRISSRSGLGLMDVVLVLVFPPNRRRMGLCPHVFGEILVINVFTEVGLTYDRPTLHRPMLLRVGEDLKFARRLKRYPGDDPIASFKMRGKASKPVP